MKRPGPTCSWFNYASHNLVTLSSYLTSAKENIKLNGKNPRSVSIVIKYLTGSRKPALCVPTSYVPQDCWQGLHLLRSITKHSLIRFQLFSEEGICPYPISGATSNSSSDGHTGLPFLFNTESNLVPAWVDFTNVQTSFPGV